MPQDADPQDRDKDLAADVLRAIRKSVRDNRINPDLHPYIARSRIIAQTIHPYMNIHHTFYAGVPDAARLTNEDAEEQDEGAEEDDAEEDDMEYTEEEVHVFKAIMKLEQGFTSIVRACSTDAQAFLGLIHHILEAASRNDTSKLKGSILELLYEDPKLGSKFEADYDIERLLSSDPKDIRGFYHLDTANLLCPLRMKDEFDDNPVDFTNKVIDGEIKITENDFPCFVYESGTVYDPNDEMTGLFRGYILVRAFRQIFTGPSSALHPKRNANRTKAKKFQLTMVTGRMIAYTAAQTYLSLSSAKKWDTFIDNFNLDDFYGNIVEIFEQNANSPFINETLEWWHVQIPGLRPLKQRKKGRTHPERSQKDPTPAQRLKAQLEEKEHQLKEAECQLKEKQQQLKEQQCQLRQQELLHREETEDAEWVSQERPRYQVNEEQDDDFFWSDLTAPVDRDSVNGATKDGKYEGSKDDTHSDRSDDDDEEEEITEQRKRAARQEELKKMLYRQQKDHKGREKQQQRVEDQNPRKKVAQPSSALKKSSQGLKDGHRKENHTDAPKPSAKPSKLDKHHQVAKAPDNKPTSKPTPRLMRAKSKCVLADLSESELTPVESPPPKKVQGTKCHKVT